jgi:hypothetical protein
MLDSVFPAGFGNSAFSDLTVGASAGSTRDPAALLESDQERDERLALPPDARQKLWVVLNRTPSGGRYEATMSVIHGRPVRSLATNREPAVGG